MNESEIKTLSEGLQLIKDGYGKVSGLAVHIPIDDVVINLIFAIKIIEGYLEDK